VRFHPDDDVENRLEQETQLRTLYDAVQVSGHELLLEVVPPKHPPRADDTVYRSMKRLYNIGIRPEWWKLEPMSPEAWRLVDALLEERDPSCRGVVLLGLNASIEELSAGFREARQHRSCRGFAVGRTVFQEPSRKWLAGEIDDGALVTSVRVNLEALVRAWEEAGAVRAEDATWAARSA
jgi:5-dehydro-2-deoxygluconokinase